jgi:cephalosporin hydroxylase
MFLKRKINYTDLVKFDVNSLEAGHHKLLYKDVPIIKCPFDYVIYQMILWEVKPDLIIEIGTNRGGSALYFADLLDLIGHGQIHTIDIEDMVYDEVKKHKRINFFTDGYKKYDLKNIDGFKNILIIEDGSHTYEDVKATLSKFKSVVSKDSYFIVEDGILDKLGWKRKYNGGPNKAIKEFISQNDTYIIDRKWCDLFGTNATFNTNGFLKKII